MFDISEFSAIINPPQCGILAIGSGRPVIGNILSEYSQVVLHLFIIYIAALNGKPQTVMTATLSYDSRAISESAASDFLETLQRLLQTPATLLLTSSVNKKRASN